MVISLLGMDPLLRDAHYMHQSQTRPFAPQTFVPTYAMHIWSRKESPPTWESRLFTLRRCGQGPGLARSPGVAYAT